MEANESPERETEETTSATGRYRYMAAAAGLSLVAVFLLGATTWKTCLFSGCPDVSGLDGWKARQASIVLDREGAEVTRLFEERRTVVALDSLPPYVADAFIAIEDRRFHEHEGVDWIRIGGAMRSNVKAGGAAQGGSTITMQLARNLYPEHLPATERTFTRKVKEMRVARMIEGEIDKRRILELYLNQIYFGEGAYGIEAAAQQYFAVPARQLSLAQAATLAAMPRAPAVYDPLEHPATSKEGRDMVLRLMASAGMIPRVAAEASIGAAVAAVPPEERTRTAPWFAEEVRQRLEAEFGRAVYTGGYRIHTTLDRNAQQALEEELEEQAVAIEEGRLGRFRGQEGERLEFAGVVLDPHSGDVLAMVGGRDFEASKFNRATQAMRQPGSAFKPIVFAAALDAGHSPVDLISDEPIAIETPEGDTWRPRNFSRDNYGLVSMREALVRSRNVATVRLAQEVGIRRIAQLAEQLGIAAHVPAYPSLPLGTVETTPLALTAAYAAFATLGERPEPRMITRVEDRHGNTVWEAPAAVSRPVLDEEAAFLVTDLMRGVVDGGTGWRVRRAGFYGPAAGKTGTTQDGADLWFAGFTPTRVATIWFGFDRRRTVIAGGTGGDIAAPVWGRVMRRIAGEERESWDAPAGLARVRVDGRGIVLAQGCMGMEPIRTVWVRSGPFGPEGDCPPPVGATILRGDENGIRVLPVRRIGPPRSGPGMR